MKKSTGKKSGKSKQTELNTLFAELRTEYLETFDEKIDQIQRIWQSYDSKSLESEFHKIKGTGSTYGIKEATQLAEVMEDLCHQGTPQLGMCVLLSIDILVKIRKQYQQETPYDLSKDPGYKFLRARQDELESA
jgi:HPt (histidine-containing phosphotransfer) domain-containing protein